MSLKRRLGKFTITRRLIDDIVEGRAGQDAAASWSSIFGKVVVIATHERYDTGEIEYLGYSEEFAEIEPYVAAPLYHAIISRHEGFVGAQPVVTFDAKFQRV